MRDASMEDFTKFEFYVASAAQGLVASGHYRDCGPDFLAANAVSIAKAIMSAIDDATSIADDDE